jgi:hypothetical protein
VTFTVFTKIPIQQFTLDCTIKQVEVEALEPLKSVKTLRIINNIYIRVSDLVNILGVYKDKNNTEYLVWISIRNMEHIIG